jgi:hypothetical protein
MSFQFKTSKDKPTHDIKEVKQPANRNERLEKLHNELRVFIKCEEKRSKYSFMRCKDNVTICNVQTVLTELPPHFMKQL